MSILTPIYGFIKSQIGDNIGKTIDEDLPANWDKVETLINTLDAEVVAHKADGVHENVEAINTDDATSVIDAPLKSAGGLAVAKKAYIGDVVNINGQFLISKVYDDANVHTNRSIEILIPRPTSRSYAKIRVVYVTLYSQTDRQLSIEGIVMWGASTPVFLESFGVQKTNANVGDLSITTNGENILIQKTAGSSTSQARLCIFVESSHLIDLSNITTT